MKHLFLALLASLALPHGAYAEETKTCAAIKQCRVVQKGKAGKKAENFIRRLRFDELCGADQHSLPLEKNQELEISLDKENVVARLIGAGGAELAKKRIKLTDQKLELKYRPKRAGELSVEISCKP